MTDQIWSLFHQALASGSRSTVLKPLGWLVALTLAGSISSFHFGSPSWFSNAIGVLSIISIILYFVAYVYFGITDKDSLRSERYSIQKMAIEKGFIGDDQAGFFKTNLVRNENKEKIISVDSFDRSEE